MKKILFAISIVVLLASCSKNDFTPVSGQTKGDYVLTVENDYYDFTRTYWNRDFMFPLSNTIFVNNPGADIVLTGQIRTVIPAGLFGEASLSARLKYWQDGHWEYIELGSVFAYRTGEVDENGDLIDVGMDSCSLNMTVTAPIAGEYVFEVYGYLREAGAAYLNKTTMSTVLTAN